MNDNVMNDDQTMEDDVVRNQMTKQMAINEIADQIRRTVDQVLDRLRVDVDDDARAEISCLAAQDIFSGPLSNPDAIECLAEIAGILDEPLGWPP